MLLYWSNSTPVPEATSSDCFEMNAVSVILAATCVPVDNCATAHKTSTEVHGYL